ncbi:MAG: nucleoid occlusion factor SlmA [Gammaproteobacteria bacterium]|nr:nucleoid occlusion factor SlmA [Gammaproteobacteria bacterium]MDJ0871293.1 nucleoid occlusion factor SlmA [Gammaproteobacteria bacterium]MDJ0890447.1 nucleoid occlusion factor SlmA [Gammaproteobacteria bacterium]
MQVTGVVPRREQILQALARELETSPGSRITTARLAGAVGVSEAALYRHFPSKAKMFEALIAFAEDSVFGQVKRILAQESEAARRCERIMFLLLGFSERNPGITRVLLGDVLAGEHARLQERVAQFFNRIETQFRQILREGEATSEETPMATTVPVAASLLVALVEGKMLRYVRSRFKRAPLEEWDRQWQLLAATLFGTRS